MTEEIDKSDSWGEIMINAILSKKDLLFKQISKSHQEHEVNDSKKPKDASKPVAKVTIIDTIIEEDFWIKKVNLAKMLSPLILSKKTSTAGAADA